MWSKRHRDLSRLRCQAACRLHAVLCEIVPGGVPKAITAAAATALLDSTTPAGPVAAARHQLAAEHAADLRQLDDKLRDTRRKISAAVRASGSTLTGLFGVGPVITATVLGDVADIARFPSRDHFAAYNGTAPVEVSSGNRKVFRLSRRGNRRLATPSTASSRPTPAGQPRRPALRAREGNRGTTLIPARPAHTPSTGASDQPLPDLNPPYDPGPIPRATTARGPRPGRPPRAGGQRRPGLPRRPAHDRPSTSTSR